MLSTRPHYTHAEDDFNERRCNQIEFVQLPLISGVTNRQTDVRFCTFKERRRFECISRMIDIAVFVVNAKRSAVGHRCEPGLGKFNIYFGLSKTSPVPCVDSPPHSLSFFNAGLCTAYWLAMQAYCLCCPYRCTQQCERQIRLAMVHEVTTEQDAHLHGCNRRLIHQFCEMPLGTL